jgi:hypothetical protein
MNLGRRIFCLMLLALIARYHAKGRGFSGRCAAGQLDWNQHHGVKDRDRTRPVYLDDLLDKAEALEDAGLDMSVHGLQIGHDLIGPGTLLELSPPE